jgi:tetrahydromethanopterin S-methyltransferase subunit B
MAFKADWPDARYGFWVALGVIAAFAVIAMIKSVLSKAVSARKA